MGKVRRHDSYDRVADSVDSEGAADSLRIACEVLLPEAVAENGDACGFRGVFPWREETTAKRNCTKYWKEIRRSDFARSFLCVTTTGDHTGTLAKGAEVLKGSALGAPRENFRSGNIVMVPAAGRILLHEENQLSGVAKRDRAEEHGINGGENHGVGADAERKGENGREREGRALA